jgi:hypothetical protein
MIKKTRIKSETFEYSDNFEWYDIIRVIKYPIYTQINIQDLFRIFEFEYLNLSEYLILQILKFCNISLFNLDVKYSEILLKLIKRMFKESDKNLQIILKWYFRICYTDFFSCYSVVNRYEIPKQFDPQIYKNITDILITILSYSGPLEKEYWLHLCQFYVHKNVNMCYRMAGNVKYIRSNFKLQFLKYPQRKRMTKVMKELKLFPSFGNFPGGLEVQRTLEEYETHKNKQNKQIKQNEYNSIL